MLGFFFIVDKVVYNFFLKIVNPSRNGKNSNLHEICLIYANYQKNNAFNINLISEIHLDGKFKSVHQISAKYIEENGNYSAKWNKN